MRITNRLGLPQPFVSAVERNYTYKDKQYSVTSLIKGTCQAILERRHYDEIEKDVSEMMWLIFGSATHKILEEAQETMNQLKEEKFVIELENGYKISGISDLYDDSTKTVTDYKTASVNKVLFNDWEDYRKQVLIYCWMLRQVGFDAQRGEIVAMLKDHSKTKAETQADYPNVPIYKIGWTFTDDDFKEIEEYIFNKFEEIKELEMLEDKDLPACLPQERWHKDDKFAVIKKGNKRAKKLCDSQEEAEIHIETNKLKGYVIEKREGSDMRCENYCDVAQWCPFYQMKVGANNE